MVNMISTDLRNQLEQFVPAENIKLQEPMSSHTSFRTGGVADVFVLAENGEQLSGLIPYLHEKDYPFFLLGFGSNLLVSDHGYHGIMIKLSGGLDRIRVEGERIIAGAAASLARVARVACEHGLTGFEFASGIPGSVGGGIVMNAGAYDGEMSQIVEWVRVMDLAGRSFRLENPQMEFGYRTSIVKKQPLIVLETAFKLQPGQREQIAAYMEELASRRRQKQPLEYPSAGSTFKRPEGYFAGKLIMDAGLKGYQIGGAQVSEKHCGFVINTGQATSTHVYQLIEHVRMQVKSKYDVELEPEVILLGDF